jgi:hypothetical protein
MQDGSMSGREEKVAKKDHSGYGGDEKKVQCLCQHLTPAVQLITLLS